MMDEVVRIAPVAGEPGLIALFCRANRAEQCPLSGVQRSTNARYETFSF
jgi:hypothetical protein